MPDAVSVGHNAGFRHDVTAFAYQALVDRQIVVSGWSRASPGWSFVVSYLGTPRRTRKARLFA